MPLVAIRVCMCAVFRQQYVYNARKQLPQDMAACAPAYLDCLVRCLSMLVHKVKDGVEGQGTCGQQHSNPCWSTRSKMVLKDKAPAANSTAT
jgi:hypothetical protein